MLTALASGTLLAPDLLCLILSTLLHPHPLTTLAGWVSSRWGWLLLFSPLWASLFINFGVVSACLGGAACGCLHDPGGSACQSQLPWLSD